MILHVESIFFNELLAVDEISLVGWEFFRSSFSSTRTTKFPSLHYANNEDL